MRWTKVDGGVLPADQMRLKGRIDVGLHYDGPDGSLIMTKRQSEHTQQQRHYIDPVMKRNNACPRVGIRPFHAQLRCELVALCNMPFDPVAWDDDINSWVSVSGRVSLWARLHAVC
jgi:hypothetical protein